MAGAFEIDQVTIIILNDALRGRFHRALIAAELAQHRPRDVDAAQFLDRMICHSVVEHVAPAIGERPEHGRYMRSDCLALGPRRSLARATIELGKHSLVRDAGGIDIADAWLRHGSSL